MKDYIETSFEEGLLKPYIVEIIQAEETGFFLPVSFIQKEQGLQCIYKVKNLYPLRLIKEIEISEAVNFVQLFVNGIKEGELHYIFPEDYTVNFNLVYTDEKLELLKICYIPASEGTGAEGKILEFLYFLESRVNEDDLGYIFQMEKYIGESSADAGDFRRFLGRIRREIRENRII